MIGLIASGLFLVFPSIPGADLSLFQQLHRELGALCQQPPAQAIRVCRLHARLVVDDDGKTNTSVVAPRLSTADLRGKALIVHAGGDTYRDEPPLGGGGARVACGVVPDER